MHTDQTTTPAKRQKLANPDPIMIQYPRATSKMCFSSFIWCGVHQEQVTWYHTDLALYGFRFLFQTAMPCLVEPRTWAFMQQRTTLLG